LGAFFTIASQLPQANAQTDASSPRYLSPTGIDSSNTCAISTAPCATLQHTLNTAAVGDTILIAGGVYTDIVISGGVTQVAVISQAVTIQGGYTAVFTEPPDPVANPTIFDGNAQGRVLTILDANQVQIDGLQLTGGLVNGQYDRGGGLYVRDSQLALSSSTIHHNQAGYGGGIYLQNSQIELAHNQIMQNSAQFSGGGIRCYGCAGTIQHNQVMSNTAVLFGGGFQITGSPVNVTANMVQYNTTSVSGQGRGGGIHIQNSSDTSLHGNLISQNSAFAGGGIRLFDSSATLQSNIIQDNQAQQSGGILLEKESNAYLENNAFLANNSSTQNTGITILDSMPQLHHNTFNDSGETAVLVAGTSQVNLNNTLIANQTNGVINDGAVVTLTTTLWDNVSTLIQGSVAQSGSVTGTAGFAADGYHLTAVSDALNKAAPSATTTDIDNQIRPHLGGADIGADEWWPLDARKTVSQQIVQPGEIVTYTIQLTNTNTLTSHILITDTLPLLVDFIGPLSASTGSAAFNAGTVLWQGSLASQESVTIFWPVQIQDDLQPGTTISNSALIQNEEGTFETTTAVMFVPSEIYLPLILK
jgi:uncharacterized repeat protein (TIGR01451 family)